ncbi:MAG: LamG-like jellyroll fold domain-containing protein, partial [Limisphaerales bacterium]
TNVITDISQHYADGIGQSQAGVYEGDVMNDNPAIYLRMDAPAIYTPPPISAWPVLANYGSVGGINGVYTPGTMPGIVAGPYAPGGAPLIGLSGSAVAQLSGISSFADAGPSSAYNPTGSNAIFTVSAMFRGNPCDNRLQTIVGHGANSWVLAMSTNGRLVFNAGNGNGAGGSGNAPGDVTTAEVYNDGNWHQVVAVNATNVISIYVDGKLDTNGIPSGISATNVIPGNLGDVMIGTDPGFTNNPAGAGRQFAGQICEVAFFANALSAGQIGALYSITETNVPAFLAPAPPAIASAAPGATLVVPAGADGSAPLYYLWQIITNSVTSTVASGLTNGLPLNATLTVPDVPAGWNGGQLELTVTNAYGTNTAFVTLSIVSPINPNPTNIVFSVINNELTLTWPSDHTGWTLQAQTNSLAAGISTNWATVANSQTTNQMVVPINLTNGTVFYRLIYP